MNISMADRLKKLSDDTKRINMYKEIIQNRILSLESEEKGLLYKADLYQKCSEIFKNWLEESMKQNIDSISELATTGLKHVIHDQRLSFNIKQEHRVNRLNMRFILEEDGVEGDPLSSFGGGAAVVISLVLRLAVMARMKMANLLLLDESMVALANEYVPSAAAFMRQLAEETGFNILMVTHNPEFLNHAHIAYEGFKENGCLKLNKI